MSENGEKYGLADTQASADRRQAADYAMALDLIAQMAQLDSEEAAVEKLREVFSALFAPNRLFYVPSRGLQDTPVKGLAMAEEDIDTIEALYTDPKSAYASTRSGTGFMVKIRHGGHLQGIMVVDEISFPEYMAHYLSLSMSITDVCGLAIENARRHQLLVNSEIRLRKEKEKLEEAFNKVKQMSGLLPICAHCKKIRDDQGYWKQLEQYIEDHSEAEFTHSICVECTKEYFSERINYGETVESDEDDD